MPPSSEEAATPMEEICPICKGAGYFCMDVPISDPNFGILNTCQCKQAEKEVRQRDKLWQQSNLLAFENKTFETFKPQIEGVSEAYNRAMAFAQAPKGWLLLFGMYGCGKTHLAAAIANEAVRREYQTIFMVVPDLLDYLRSTFGPSSEVAYDERFDKIRNIKLLVLDDLGAESSTAWAREKLFQIINHRYNHHLPTVFTTNVDLDKLDPRITSRLLDVELCRQTVIQAKDYRQTTRNNNIRYK
ncbi:ATP-binding protein [Herpetosiphon geysericola]|uniref:ATP-binding protein n=1 Tax=Herpetosiphon geysericola TaxID=70996 RepID=UPI0038B34608